MDRENIKRLLIDKIQKEEWLPFIEIEDFFKKKEYDYKGENALFLPNKDGSSNENIVIWNGWNETTTKMICEILEENYGKIAFKMVTNPIEFACMGGGLNLPIAQSIKRKYKTQHWLPGVLIYVK